MKEDNKNILIAIFLTARVYTLTNKDYDRAIAKKTFGHFKKKQYLCGRNYYPNNNYNHNNCVIMLKDSQINPFVIGKYVSDEYFCDRNEETELLRKQHRAHLRCLHGIVYPS